MSLCPDKQGKTASWPLSFTLEFRAAGAQNCRTRKAAGFQGLFLPSHCPRKCCEGQTDKGCAGSARHVLSTQHVQHGLASHRIQSTGAFSKARSHAIGERIFLGHSESRFHVNVKAGTVQKGPKISMSK